MRAIKRKEIVEEVKKQLWLAGPLFSVGLLFYSIQAISVMFVGHLGELALSGASLATSFASVTGFNLLMGLGCALDTLCGQSFGAMQFHMLGIHTQRAMFILLLTSAFLSVIWANTKPILIVMHQNSEISKEAGVYATFMIPCLFAYGLLQCLIKFLQTQNIVFPMVLSTGISALIHIPVCWILVFKSGLGSKGAAIANSISCWINVLLMALYIKFSSSCKETWTGFSKEALHNLAEFLKIAIPSALMLCLKVWSFELIIFLSGLLPNPQLQTSVLSICQNTFGLLWTIPFGLGAAVSIRVSNELGAGKPKAARLAVRVVLVMAITEGMLVGLLMILLRNIWGHVYSHEQEVVKYVAVMMPIVALSSFLDGLQGVISGVARGCGWQKIAAYVNLGSFYLVGAPCAVLFAFFFHMKGKGLWLGLICALIVQVIFFLIITINSNWEKEAEKAAERVNDSKNPSGEDFERPKC
ncbi:protein DETOXIFICATION 16-like isoform X1 [Quercus lobata]|uniref:protein DETOXIFICATION 16-like isoform X1 n=1 Tax=Quercus lobata TaxID=97700 RepID=UPI001244CB2A|nr:protein DETOXIFICATION 16-like isoform X1 [Quercus lobata]